MLTNSLESYFEEECLRCPCALQHLVLYIRLFSASWRQVVANNRHLQRKLSLYAATLNTLIEKRSAQLEYGEYCDDKEVIHLVDRKDASTCHIGVDEILVDAFVSFRESVLWTCQRDFYRGRQLDAWSVIPFEISSNRAVCQLYIDHMLSAWKSTYPHDRNVAVCVVEIGAGHGMLSIMMAQELRHVRCFP